MFGPPRVFSISPPKSGENKKTPLMGEYHNLLPNNGGIKIRMAGRAKMTCQNGKNCQCDIMPKMVEWWKPRVKQYFSFFLEFGTIDALYADIENDTQTES